MYGVSILKIHETTTKSSVSWRQDEDDWIFSLTLEPAFLAIQALVYRPTNTEQFDNGYPCLRSVRFSLD